MSYVLLGDRNQHTKAHTHVHTHSHRLERDKGYGVRMIVHLSDIIMGNRNQAHTSTYTRTQPHTLAGWSVTKAMGCA